MLACKNYANITSPNLPVKDLSKTRAFFEHLGYSFNPQFSNDDAGCMVISDTIYAMLLTETYFKTFIKKEIADAQKTTEVLLALSVESREAVDEMLKKVLAAGGTETGEAQDHGFMYLRTFYDLDGHTWEIFWMDPAAAQG